MKNRISALEVIIVVLLKRILKGNKSNINKVAITKNNSSRKRQVIIRAVLLPASIPSRFRNHTIRLLPPTEDGVTADVNSHNTFTLNACFQLSCLSVIYLYLHINPTSRLNMKNIARRI